MGGFLNCVYWLIKYYDYETLREGVSLWKIIMT